MIRGINMHAGTDKGNNTTVYDSTPVCIAIASGKGGTGKTFVSVNLYYSLLEKGLPVCLVDCDAEEPNVQAFFGGRLLQTDEVYQQIPELDSQKCTLCGLCADYCNYNAIFYSREVGLLKIIPELCHGCNACFVACQYDALKPVNDELGKTTFFEGNITESRMKVGVHSPVKIIKESISKTKCGGITLLDSPPGTSCPFIQTVAEADYVILVTEPTPFGLSDLIQSAETLKTINKPYGVIINKAGMGDNQVYEYLNAESIELLLEIPFSREIASICSEGQILSKQNTEWQENFTGIFGKIMKHVTCM